MTSKPKGPNGEQEMDPSLIALQSYEQHPGFNVQSTPDGATIIPAGKPSSELIVEKAKPGQDTVHSAEVSHQLHVNVEGGRAVVDGLLLSPPLVRKNSAPIAGTAKKPGNYHRAVQQSVNWREVNASPQSPAEIAKQRLRADLGKSADTTSKSEDSASVAKDRLLLMTDPNRSTDLSGEELTPQEVQLTDEQSSEARKWIERHSAQAIKWLAEDPNDPSANAIYQLLIEWAQQNHNGEELQTIMETIAHAKQGIPPAFASDVDPYADTGNGVKSDIAELRAAVAEGHHAIPDSHSPEMSDQDSFSGEALEME